MIGGKRIGAGTRYFRSNCLSRPWRIGQFHCPQGVLLICAQRPEVGEDGPGAVSQLLQEKAQRVQPALRCLTAQFDHVALQAVGCLDGFEEV
jgi:hypothetical protein